MKDLNQAGLWSSICLFTRYSQVIPLHRVLFLWCRKNLQNNGMVAHKRLPMMRQFPRPWWKSVVISKSASAQRLFWFCCSFWQVSRVMEPHKDLQALHHNFYLWGWFRTEPFCIMLLPSHRALLLGCRRCRWNRRMVACKRLPMARQCRVVVSMSLMILFLMSKCA